MDIEFGELPPSKTPRAIAILYGDAAEKLRANPGQWARITTSKDHTAAANVAYRIRHGLAVAFHPAGAFESTNRGADVWVRYVGDAS